MTQGRVECLYLVASGTLDEVLWRLIEKKFRDLGKLEPSAVTIEYDRFSRVSIAHTCALIRGVRRRKRETKARR